MCPKEYIQKYLKSYDENIQISSTGIRAYLVFIALMLGPKTYEEIRDFLFQCGFNNYSIDTARMDINTLKATGCEITKALKTKEHKYSIVSHPYKVCFSSFELFFLRESYKIISKTCSPETILYYHYIFCKLAFISNNEQTKEDLLGISMLKGMNIIVMKALVAEEYHHNKVMVAYKIKNKIVNYDITLEKIGLRSNKLYAFCYNHTLKKRTFLKVSKIIGIFKKEFDRKIKYGLDACVKFKLFRGELHPLDKNETVVETNSGTLIVEGQYYNEFIAQQRILSFGNDCVVIKPDCFREKIIEKLLEIKEHYSRG